MKITEQNEGAVPMNPPSAAVVKKCCAICWHGEYQDNMILCASNDESGALDHHEFNDVCKKFTVDPLLECIPEDSVAYLVSFIKDVFPNGCNDVRHCYDCVLYKADDRDCSAENYICEMLSSLEGMAKGE